jgi:hypothetical protein
MINEKINNKSIMRRFYEQKYKTLNQSQLSMLLFQHSYNAKQAYIDGQGYIA